MRCNINKKKKGREDVWITLIMMVTQRTANKVDKM